MTDDLRPALLRLAAGAVAPVTSAPVIRARAVRRRRLRRAAWCGALAGALVLARRPGRGEPAHVSGAAGHRSSPP